MPAKFLGRQLREANAPLQDLNGGRSPQSDGIVPFDYFRSQNQPQFLHRLENGPSAAGGLAGRFISPWSRKTMVEKPSSPSEEQCYGSGEIRWLEPETGGAPDEQGLSSIRSRPAVCCCPRPCRSGCLKATWRISSPTWWTSWTSRRSRLAMSGKDAGDRPTIPG